jgi:hypothetical protein
LVIPRHDFAAEGLKPSASARIVWGRTKPMSSHPKKPATEAAPRPPHPRSHKFTIGAIVALNGGAEQASFKVTGHLPDGGAGPQYRLKSERENYERVAPETRLTLLQK